MLSEDRTVVTLGGNGDQEETGGGLWSAGKFLLHEQGAGYMVVFT